jgi:hypothetical protein
MGDREYLIGYGNAGDFGRFRSSLPDVCRRDDWVVVRSPRGQELGVILRPASAEHGRLLADHFVGQILRSATDGDLQLAQRMEQRSQKLFDDSRQLAGELNLPLEILDAEIMLDGRQAVLHYLRWAECDPRSLMDPLADRYRLLITLHDLALPSTQEAEEQPEHASCGNGDCGTGGCGSCSQGNCASCLTSRAPADKASSQSLRNRPAVFIGTAAVLESPARVPLI